VKRGFGSWDELNAVVDGAERGQVLGEIFGEHFWEFLDKGLEFFWNRLIGFGGNCIDSEKIGATSLDR
jgi:hypothetical protein